MGQRQFLQNSIFKQNVLKKHWTSLLWVTGELVFRMPLSSLLWSLVSQSSRKPHTHPLLISMWRGIFTSRSISPCCLLPQTVVNCLIWSPSSQESTRYLCRSDTTTSPHFFICQDSRESRVGCSCDVEEEPVPVLERIVSTWRKAGGLMVTCVSLSFLNEISVRTGSTVCCRR